MTKVTPTARHSAIAAGVTAVAALGAVAGSVSSAHASVAPGLTGGLPLNTNALDTVRGLTGPLKGLPVVGNLSGMLGGVGAAPMARSRMVAAPAANPAPAVDAAPAAGSPASYAPPMVAPMMPSMAAQAMKPIDKPADSATSSLDGVSKLTKQLPLVGQLPIFDSLPLGGLAGGLGHIGG
jgi:hypothetical protein